LYSQVSENIGTLYSSKWVLTNILGFSDSEILEMKASLLEEEEENLNKDVNDAANKTIDNVFDEETEEEEEPEEFEEEPKEPEEFEEPANKEPTETPNTPNAPNDKQKEFKI
jgi:outer membrane biosynthesis protein TonB